MRSRNGITLLLSIGVFLGFFQQRVEAQTEFEISPQDPTYVFGERLAFRAVLESAEDIEKVVLFVQAGDHADLEIIPVEMDRLGNLSSDIDLQAFPLPGFADIRYWYQVSTSGGETFQSPVYSFAYQDNRYEWDVVSDEQFNIHWYSGDLDFGKELLNVTLVAGRDIQELLDIFVPDNLDLYAYESIQDMQAALPSEGSYWIAGHAAPMQEVILVSLPPGPDQRLEMERQIPHELMHAALNYTDANAYSKFPVWFNEGLASMVELYPDPEYENLTKNAFEASELIPMIALCQSFPSDQQQARLAYAQSASFTKFLYDQYGKTGFNRMMAAYASGLSCERGIQEALGENLESLEQSWQRSSFAGVTLGIAFRELLPWLLVLLALLAVPLVMVVIVMKKRPARSDYE